MIRNFRIAEGKMVVAATSDAQVQLFVAPDAGETEELQRSFGVDAHTLSSALDPEEVSRIELMRDCTAIIWKRPVGHDGASGRSLEVTSVGLFVRGGRLGIVCAQDLALLDDRVPPRVTPVSVMDVLLNVLDASIRCFLDDLRAIKAMSHELQEKVAHSLENRYLVQMFGLSESLVYYIDGISENGVVLDRLREHLESSGAPSAQLASLEDIIVENRQCNRQAEIYSTILAGLMDARGNLVNNNMNVLLKKLTIINIVFLPLNLIASIGGMSEYTMMTRHLDWRISYVFLMVSMIVIGALTAVLMHHLDMKSRHGT